MLNGLPVIGERAGVAPTRALRLCTTAMPPTVAITTSVLPALAFGRFSRLGRGAMKAPCQPLAPPFPNRVCHRQLKSEKASSSSSNGASLRAAADMIFTGR